MNTALTDASPTSPAIKWPGGRGTLDANGTWGGGTITLTYCEFATGTFVPIGSGVSLSANGSTGFEIRGGFLKAALSGNAGATVNWGFGITRSVP